MNSCCKLFPFSDLCLMWSSTFLRIPAVVIYTRHRLISPNRGFLLTRNVRVNPPILKKLGKYHDIMCNLNVFFSFSCPLLRLLYQSRKRGMLENGLLLSTFASRYLNGMSEAQTTMYDRLINLPSNDWDIFYWATCVKDTPVEFDNEIMNMLKEHVQNKDRESRFKQPDL